jgi:murein DD-endopeptidase MepM/ murein hydrolase activator NlpD
VSVSKKFTEPSAEQLKTIAEDKQVKESLFNRITLQREWSGDFRAPVQAQISDVFGTERVFNGKVQSYHQGLDYGVPSGTSVSALNSGTVLLARNLYFEGNCVVIDHGQGLLTLYLHLSEFAVKEGQRVKRGEVIGLSGGTGRATGPHLHVAVRWQGIYLDPATLMTLKLPASPTP